MNQFGNARERLLFRNFRCWGDEEDLLSCDRNKVRLSYQDCGVWEAAGVICSYTGMMNIIFVIDIG